MSKFLKRCQRNFNACSDCAYFQKGDPIDERYKDIVYGFCQKLEKAVDNRWRTDCVYCTYGHTCEECIHCMEYEEMDKDEEVHKTFCCECHYDEEINENDDVCEDFESYYEIKK